MRAVVLVPGALILRRRGAAPMRRPAKAARRRAGDARGSGGAPALHNVYDGPWEFFVGGGGAAFDCDGSGFPSVFLAGGKNPAQAVRQQIEGAAARSSSRRSRSTSAPIPSCSPTSSAPIRIDIDGDGHMDLFVLRVGGNLLLKGGPDCTFTLANKEWGFDGDSGWTTAFAADWEPGQKFPTFAIGHYVDRDAPGSPWGTCEDNSLYRPQPGDKPDYSVRTPLAPGFCALSMLFTDWNKSGVPSLRVSNDRQYYRGGEEQMWRVEPGKTPRLYTRADGWRHLSIFGMGIAEGDLDGSGYPAIFPHLDGRRRSCRSSTRRGGPRRSSGLSRHRGRSWRDGAYSLHRRRQTPLDRLAR